MHWLFPAFLLGMLAVALPILLHLLRRRPVRHVAFPSLRFLIATQPRNDRSQRVRRLLVLMLRCATLALLAAAFARPFVGGDLADGRRAVVVVVDASFSMRADGRWTALRAWGLEKLESLRPGDKAGLLLSGTRPRWLVPLTTDLGTVRAQLARLEPGWEITRVEPALRLAGATLAVVADRREIVFLGDHQRVSWAGFEFGKPLPPGVTAVFPSVTKPVARQAALFAPKFVRTTDGWRAEVPVRNFSGPQTRTLRIFRDDASVPVHEEVVTLGEKEARVLEIALPTEGTAHGRFRLELEPDDLPADDVGFAVAAAGSGARVLLDAPPPGSSADFVAVALAAAEGVEPALTIEQVPAGAWPERAVAVLRNDASFAGEAGGRLAAFLRRGGAALVFVDGGLSQTAWLARHAGIEVQPLRSGAARLVLRDWAMDHALIAGLSAHSVTPLLDWNFTRGWALPVDVVEPLALWPGGGAAIGEMSIGAGHVLVCGFPADRSEGDWAVREAFVPFVHRAAAYLHGAREHAMAKPLVVGDQVTLPTEIGRWRAIDGPAANEPAVEVRGTATPQAPGVYEFSDGAALSYFAVNLSEEESDPAAWSEGTPWTQLGASDAESRWTRGRGAAAETETEQQGQLWWWAVAAMGVLLLAETGLANRTSR